MIYALHHGAVLAIALAAVPALLRSRWTQHCPRVAVVLWQAIVFAIATAAVGLLLAVGLRPYGRGVVPGLALLVGDVGDPAGPDATPTGFSVLNLVATTLGLLLAAVLCAAIVRVTWATGVTRRRHRNLLNLLARHDTRAGEALVLDHPAAAAYFLPGRRPSIVLSAGTLDLLTAPQVRAVLAHERAHAVERHHLVLLPFVALRRIAPCRAAADAVRLLIELCADDRAARECGRDDLADALERFAAAGHAPTPAGVLAATDAPTRMRIARLRGQHHSTPAAARIAILAASLTLAATPLSLFALPWSP